jgi:hypothetical protein
LVLALVLATLAVALGTGLGLAPIGSPKPVAVLRSFALIAGLVVVFAHILPEAVHAIGIGFALLVFAAGAVLPIGLERLLHGRPTDGADIGLELGFWGLMVHHVADGLALGAIARISDGPFSHLDVLVALVAHTVPLVAVVAAAYARREGRRGAAFRCAGFAVASGAGLWLASWVDAGVMEAFEAWISAAVAGLLVHVAVHDLKRPRVGDPI